MIIDINAPRKTVEIWLTNADQQDPDLNLNSLYRDYGSRGYLVVTYRSGKSDLLECTQALLSYNRTSDTPSARG